MNPLTLEWIEKMHLSLRRSRTALAGAGACLLDLVEMLIHRDDLADAIILHHRRVGHISGGAPFFEGQILLPARPIRISCPDKDPTHAFGENMPKIKIGR